MPSAAVEIAAEGLDQDVVDQRALARAGNAGDAHERAQGDLDVDILEVVVRGAADDQLTASPARRGGRRECRSVCRPERYCPVTLLGIGHDLR